MEKNLKINKGVAQLNINPKIYNMECIFSACYVFLDIAYIVIDGDPEKEILINIKPKDAANLVKVASEFFNELINYADYENRAQKTRNIRELIIQRSLFANDPNATQIRTEKKMDDEEINKILDEVDDDDEFLDDPEGIAIPWEEKYGKKDNVIEDNSNEQKKNLPK